MIRRNHATPEPIISNARLRVPVFCVVLLAGFSVLTEPGVAAKKTTKPVKVTVANGKVCAKGGVVTTASGRSFTCVRLKSKALQWWSVGTIQNPVRFGQTARVAGTASGAWEITVVRRIDDDTERILAIEASNRLATSGNTIASVELRAKSLGPDAETSIRATSFEAATAVRDRVGRWDLGQTAEEDCWRNERVANGADKTCQFPFEITSGAELAALRLSVRPSFGIDAPVYFDTATDQPPLR